MKISVITVGKVRDRRLLGLSDEYQERLGHHVPVETREVKKAKSADAEAVMREEAERLVSATPDGALTVAVTEEGKAQSSIEIAQGMNQWMVEARHDVVFYIGGAHGLAPDLKRKANRRWSLSPMTFPHDIARMLLWEQLYRAMSIIRNEPYHK